jgi:membrane-associated phospholipid phosphatase
MLLENKSTRATLFFLAVIAACIAGYAFFDIPLSRYCNASNDQIRNIFEYITKLGLSTAYLIASAAGFIYFRFIKRNYVLACASIFLFAAIAISGLANDLIKVLVGRSRPILLFSDGIYGFRPFSDQYAYNSFPSGHSNTIAALCYGLYKVSGRCGFILLIAALAVVASRVVLGAHFPSDVIFGAYLGLVITQLLWQWLLPYCKNRYAGL